MKLYNTLSSMSSGMNKYNQNRLYYKWVKKIPAGYLVILPAPWEKDIRELLAGVGFEPTITKVMNLVV